MIDVDDGHRLRFIVDFIDDAILAATSRIHAGEVLAQGFPNTSWFVEEVARDEVHDGCGYGFGKTLRDLTRCCARNDECVARLAIAWHAGTGW